MAYREPYSSGMLNQDYWKQRAKESLSESFETADEVNEYLEGVYKKSLIDFCRDYNNLMKPFVKNGKVDPAAVNAAMANDRNFQAKYNWLYNNITNIGEKIRTTENQEVTEALKSIYSDTVERTVNDFGSVYKYDSLAVDRAVHTPWTRDGREFSGRIWDNTEHFQEDLRKTLSNAVSKGESIQKSVREFKKIYGNTTYNTSRIMRTETMAIHNRASLDSYSSLGLEYLEILPEADACDVCQSYANKQVPIEGAEEGADIPPFHPFCRCCVMPVVRKD